jgi:small subunit ribosomal protein S1
MSWTKRVKNPSKILNLGEEVEALVLARDIPNGASPWPQADRAQSLGCYRRKIFRPAPSSKVRSRTSPIFGLFVVVEEGIVGLVHISDISWTKRVKHPSELFPKGDMCQGGGAQHRP